MVDHVTGHAAVYADVFAGDKTGLRGAEEEHSVGDIERISHAAYGMLVGIGTCIFCKCGVDPSG